MEDGQKITFGGEGDQEPGMEPGDIIIVLDEKEHPVFKRSGIDLIMQQNINITEALCGFKKIVPTLDDRTLVIQTVSGKYTLDLHEISRLIGGNYTSGFENLMSNT
jgi:DnaJ family protein A protein 1